MNEGLWQKSIGFLVAVGGCRVAGFGYLRARGTKLQTLSSIQAYFMHFGSSGFWGPGDFPPSGGRRQYPRVFKGHEEGPLEGSLHLLALYNPHRDPMSSLYT